MVRITETSSKRERLATREHSSISPDTSVETVLSGSTGAAQSHSPHAARTSSRPSLWHKIRRRMDRSPDAKPSLAAGAGCVLVGAVAGVAEWMAVVSTHLDALLGVGLFFVGLSFVQMLRAIR